MIKISKMQLIRNFLKSFNSVRFFWILSKLVSRIQEGYSTLFIVQGKEKKSQSDMTLLFFGKKESLNYLSNIIYGNEPLVKKITTALIWSIQKKIDFYLKDVDLIVVQTDRFFSHFLMKKGFIIIPEWIEMSMKTQRNFQNLWEILGSSAQKDIRTIQKYGFSYEISQDPKKLDFFYFNMCLPYMMNRHGKLALLDTIDYENVKRNFRRGFLLLIKDKEKYIAGSIIIIRKKTAYPVYMGIVEEKLNLHRGVGAALYYFPFVWAMNNEIQNINFGNTRTFLNSGDFQFKRKWKMTAQRSDIFFGIYGLMMNPNSKEKVLNFLENHPLICTNGIDLKGLIVTQQALTYEKIDVLWKNYSTEGLTKLLIFTTYYFENLLNDTVNLSYKNKIVLIDSIEKIN